MERIQGVRPTQHAEGGFGVQTLGRNKVGGVCRAGGSGSGYCSGVYVGGCGLPRALAAVR